MLNINPQGKTPPDKSTPSSVDAAGGMGAAAAASTITLPWRRPRKHAPLRPRLDPKGNLHPNLVGLDPTGGESRGHRWGGGTKVTQADVLAGKVRYAVADMGYASAKETWPLVGINAIATADGDVLDAVGTNPARPYSPHTEP